MLLNFNTYIKTSRKIFDTIQITLNDTWKIDSGFYESINNF